MVHEPASRRAVLAATASVGAALLLPAAPPARAAGRITFTILHTNDLHSNLIGMAPSSDYSPATLNDDATRGGFERLATLITRRRAARAALGPVLVLDAGDYSMGTAFAGATRETGCELQLLAMVGCDATTFGNHDFDLGPDGTARSIGAAASAGRLPPVVASNTNFPGTDPSLTGLQRHARDGLIRRTLVIERGGRRFGILGLLGKEAQIYTGGAGAVTFGDPVEAAKAAVAHLREVEKVDVVIALSHGGVERGADGIYRDGDDVRLPKAVPGIDVVIGAHSHTALAEPIIVNGRTPVVQTGKYGENLGELVITLEDERLTVESYRLHAVDDSIPGNAAIGEAIAGFKEAVTRVVFASRGYSVDQPLAVVPQDIMNTFSDIAASTILANLCTDAFRAATGADIGFSVNGMMRSGLTRGKRGVQTVYDVFAVAPLGAGVVDPTPGSTLVTGWFTGAELKALLEFFLVDNPAHPGEFFPRASGLRFRYDPTRPRLDVVTAVELGDLDRSYRAIDITGADAKLYSLTCPLMLGLIIVAIPNYTKGRLALVPKNRAGERLASQVAALEDPRRGTPDLLAPPGSIDRASLDTETRQGVLQEIKEWQAIMDHLRRLPVATPGHLPMVPMDARAAEVRAIRMG